MKSMLKRCLVLSSLVAVGAATAQTCPANTMRVLNGTPAAPNTGGTLRQFFDNATVCVARGAERWQEFHQVGGDLIDFKRGPNHPVDPTKKVGTWTVSGEADPRSARLASDQGPVLVHTYGSTSYSFAVCVPRAEVRRASPTFVLSSPVAGTFENVRILPGQVPCPD
jgi:hypothetical protein